MNKEFDEHFVDIVKNPTKENLNLFLEILFDQAVIDDEWLKEQAKNIKTRLKDISIDPFANQNHYLIKGVIKSADGEKEVEYIRLVRNSGHLSLDRSQNKEEIIAKSPHYYTIYNHLQFIDLDIRYIDSTYNWDLMLHELGLPCSGICFSREKKQELGLL